MLFNNSIYFAGGINSLGTNEVYRWDLNDLSWHELSTFGGAVVSRGFGIVHNSDAYIMSGSFYKYNYDLEPYNKK